MSRPIRLLVFLLATVMLHPALVAAQSASNPVCTTETVFYDPGQGQDIVVPEGYKVEVFARDLNFPTGIAFMGNKNDFKVFVLESGTGLPSICNDNTKVPGGVFSPSNPFTPGIVIFDKAGNRIAGQIGKP